MRGDKFGVQLSHATVILLTVVGITTVLLTRRFHADRWHVCAAVAAVAVLVAVLTYRQRTMLGWIRRRMVYRKSDRERIFVYSAENNVGVTWDGLYARCYVELLPDQYEVTILRGHNDAPTRSIPVDEIRDELVQFDIHCESISIITSGYKSEQSTPLAQIYHATVGPIPCLMYGRTVIEVCIELNASLDSVHARRGDDGVPTGLSRTVSIAAERIRRRISRCGWNAVLLSADDIHELDCEIADSASAVLAHEHWASCGRPPLTAVAYTPARSAWCDDNYREWLRLNVIRQLHILRLERTRLGDRAKMYVVYVTSDASDLNTVSALGLLRECSQQGNILTAALPEARTIQPTAVHGRLIEQAFPISLYAAGVGTYVGSDKNRAQIFVNFTVGTQPFYVASAVLLQQLLLRLATSGRSIDIGVPGDEWVNFAATIDATYQQNRSADIVVVTEDHLTDQAHQHQVRLVWADQPRNKPSYAIVVEEDCVLHTPDGETHYKWAVSSAEKALFTVGEHAEVLSKR